MRKARKHKVLLSFALASLMTVSGVVNVSAAVPVNEQIIKNDSAVKQARTSNETLLDWKKWVNDHAYSLSSIQPETFDGQKIPANKFNDLEMLKPLLHDKRIVFLGGKLSWSGAIQSSENTFNTIFTSRYGL